MNKTKILVVLAVVVLSGVTGIKSAKPQEVYAQTSTAETKIAVKNELSVSVNGESSAKVTAYNIDGYNYFRVADICNALNMKVSRYTTDFDGTIVEGVNIISNKPFNGTVEAPPANPNMTVIMSEIIVYFDGGYANAKSFNANDRNYVRLADIVAAANNNYEVKLESATSSAKKGIGQAITTRETTYDLKTSYDGTTNTISIATAKTDFQALYEELYMKEQGKPPVEKAIEKEATPKVEPQPEMTSPPEVGIILAKILVDEQKPAYINNKMDFSNFTTPYGRRNAGDCVWYALGRFEEVTGVEYPYNSASYDLNKVAKDELLAVITGQDKIVSRSIAVFGEAHLLFVEYVERDNNGNPTYIYFTENGYGNGGKHVPGLDGKVQKLSLEKFLIRQPNANYKGCIILK